MTHGNYLHDFLIALFFLQCHSCLGPETCSDEIDCPSKTCYKAIGKNGTEEIFVKGCVTTAGESDCTEEAKNKAEGKDVASAGEEVTSAQPADAEEVPEGKYL